MQELADAEALVRLTRRQVTQVVNNETRRVTQVRPAPEHYVQTPTHDPLTERWQLRKQTPCVISAIRMIHN